MKKLSLAFALLLVGITLLTACAVGSTTPIPVPQTPTQQPQPTSIPPTAQPSIPQPTTECHPPMVCAEPALSTVIDKREITMERSPYEVSYTSACIEDGWLYDINIIIYVDEEPTLKNDGWEVTLSGEAYHNGDQYLVDGCTENETMSVGYISFEEGQAYLNFYDWWVQIK